MSVHIEIFLRDRVGADNHFNVKSLLEKFGKSINIWAWRVAYNQSGGKVDDLRAVSIHFFSGVFNVTTGVSITGRIADQFNFHVRVDAECAFSLAHGAQTFSTRAALVAVADDNADLCGGFHKYTFLVNHYDTFLLYHLAI